MKNKNNWNGYINRYTRGKQSSLKTSGFTLIELLLVIGLISVLSVLVLLGYNKREAAVKAEAQVAWVKGVDQGIQSLAQPSDDTTLVTALTNANIIAANIIPVENISGTSIMNNFGGATTFGTKAINGRTGYTITLSGIPSRACVNLATQVGYSSDEVSVNTTVVKTAGSTADIDVALVAALCGNEVNEVQIGKGIRRVTDTVLIDSTGSLGINDSYLVPDVHESPKGTSFATCPVPPAGSTGFAPTYTKSGCTCAENQLWDGVACQTISIRYRPQGVTVGYTNPAGDSANMANFTAGIQNGSPGDFDADQQRYKMRELYDPTLADPYANPTTYYQYGSEDKNGGVGSSGNYDNPQAPNNSCINGLIWGVPVGSPPGTAASCITPVFNTLADGQISIAATWDSTKYRNCVLGANDGGRCIMPNTKDYSDPVLNGHSPSRTAPTVPSESENRDTVLNPNKWKNAVAAPTPLNAQCSGGRSWNGAACACNAATGTVWNGQFCACPSGTKYWQSTTPPQDSSVKEGDRIGGTGVCQAM